MNSLQQEISERRATKSAEFTCVSVEPGSAGLLVCQWQRESWVMPWAQFIGARLRGKDDDGVIELRFANYHVTVAGENLRALLADLAAQRIGVLRDLPAQYRSRIGEKEPFIGSIEVCASADAPEIREPS
ncbi:MAG TPA: hypothetical protein VHD76_14685 [Bryobacteraceae bacterium]|nr:hypothetical protein [Bryobacteraceae bacterium]